MSDSVANVEMEDVLSSIRRLVSDEVRAREAAPAPDSSLLLSETHRVSDDQKPSSKASNPSPGHAVVVSSQIDALTTLEATIAELEAKVSGADGFEPEVGGEKDLVEQTPAFFRSVNSEQTQDDAWEIPAEGKLAFIPPSPAVPEEPKQDDSNSAEPSPVEPLQLLPENKVAEVAVPETSDDDAEVADQETPVALNSDDDTADEEVLLDEETLRQMVQTIVREELQGALGESITRNIRRLIRREIHAYFDVKDAP